MAITYVASFKEPLRDQNGRKKCTLLWGDPVHVLDSSGQSWRVRARGREGWIAPEKLSNRGLLEIYIIDVGQGDGVLMRTPDDKWHLIDGGIANRAQMTKKGAANFLRWKFLQDLGRDRVSLATMILTHPDFDHYGGLIDVLSGKLFDGRTFQIEVKNFYHGGLARFQEHPKLGQSSRGTVAEFPGGNKISKEARLITELLDDQHSFQHPPRTLQESYGEFAALVGRVPRNVRRLSHRDRFLPGYAPGENDPTIHVLGPISERLEAGPTGLRWMTSESVTRNGHSIVLRIDYGQCRILLTGDLNKDSQRLMLTYRPMSDFSVDLAKACHHGSEDIELDFTKAMQARATVISSGDNEDYAHPRPLLMGASARYGRESKDLNGENMPPLVYCTELARSVKLAYAESLKVRRSEDATEGFPNGPGRRRVDQSPGKGYISASQVHSPFDGSRVRAGECGGRWKTYSVRDDGREGDRLRRQGFPGGSRSMSFRDGPGW